MSYYKDEVLRDIKIKRQRKEQGLHNGIPTPFKKYGDYFPYIERGMYYHILGETGIGKSTFARYMFVYEALKFSWENNYPIKILYFGLEDGKMLIYKKFIKHYLYERHQVTLPQKYLDSKEMPLAKKYLDLLDIDCDFYELFEKSVYIINDATRPSQIEDMCVKAHAKYGETHHMIAIIDNYSNIVPEEYHKSDWDAIRELSRNRIRLNLCKKLQYTVVGILQVDFETVKAATRNAGKSSITAIEPNLSSIGDAKVVSRNSFVVLALFNPNKYDIKTYPFAEGYNIEVLRDRFRSVLMLKNNNDSMAPRLPLYFDGANEIFTELPALEEKEKLEVIYNKVMQEEKEKRDKYLMGQRKMF